MNRIILIGNGFDLAHEMPTSYIDFIKHYYYEVINHINMNNLYKNEDLQILSEHPRVAFQAFENKSIKSYQELKNAIDFFNQSKYMYSSSLSPVDIRINFKNKLLERISGSLKQWVDIEHEYYEQLVGSFKAGHRKGYSRSTIAILNNDLKSIEKSLEKYLTKIEQNYSTGKSISQIESKIYSKFQLEDMSFPFINIFVKEMAGRIKTINSTRDHTIDSLINHYSKAYDNLSFNKQEIIDYCKSVFLNSKDENVLISHLKLSIKNSRIPPPDYFWIPHRILFLSFNYTHTEEKYIKDSSIIEDIHIHGEINEVNNPMIFGYGDELEDDYHQLEKLNDNEYLQNIKSIHYLDTNNYRNLLGFIESEPYQIFIMGHSCGISDRTLLNTLFEHKNCASIKPFYHKISENEDNYSDIIRNISRNFKDKILMRDRVVNKTLCEPLYWEGKV